MVPWALVVGSAKQKQYFLQCNHRFQDIHYGGCSLAWAPTS